MNTSERNDIDPDKCVVIYHVPKGGNETETTLLQKIEEIIGHGLELPGLEVVCVRHCFSDHGSIKVELTSVDNKVEVLRVKRVLVDKRQYSNMFLRSAKSHFKTLMNHMNVQHEFRFTGNGHLVYKEMMKPINIGGRGRGREILECNETIMKVLEMNALILGVKARIAQSLR